jgi:hypothetical protein
MPLHAFMSVQSDFFVQGHPFILGDVFFHKTPSVKCEVIDGSRCGAQHGTEIE